MLTKEEIIDIRKIACDLESGNFLLRPRTKEYMTFMREVCEAIETKDRTPRQTELWNEYNKCFYHGN